LPLDFVEYQYEPKPPVARNPLINRHQASVFLHCDNPCRLRIFHQCAPEVINRKTIERVPKKLSEFKIKDMNAPESEAWGLKVQHEVCATFVVAYLLLIMIPPFAFWGWWQCTHPDDLQGASVPASVVLALLTLFWGMNGIVTEGRYSALGYQ
jgi:hypothetical protein